MHSGLSRVMGVLVCAQMAVACGGEGHRGGSGGGAGGGGAGSAELEGVIGSTGMSGAGADASTPPPDLPEQGKVSKVDLLLMVDNSISMSDKQDVLGQALPELLARLANPVCVDDLGNQFPPPPSGQPCPEGQQREIEPITDIHVGVVSSSLGDVGANLACPALGLPRYVADRVDMAHLIGSLERGQGVGANAAGFLEWRSGETDFDVFSANAQQMLASVGDNGCGWEASLESWYRFLIDPFPYRGLTRVQCPGSTSSELSCVQPEVDPSNRILLDDVLLAQRAAFLRPDSLVAIVMLSDENDCSFMVGDPSAADIGSPDPMFRGSSECDQDPNAKCCYSCPLGPPDGCTADPICNADPANDVLENRLPRAQDGQNLRCFEQKRRFGTDYLYPVERYVNALTQPRLCWSALDLSSTGCTQDELIDNPLYAGGRSPSRVVLAGVVGVPWQSLASDVDASGRPLSPAQLRFKSSAELNAPSDDTWSQILGSAGTRFRPAEGDQPEVPSVAPLPPALPQMIESEFLRSGVTFGNPINGRDYDTSEGIGVPDDLQYSCIFPLPQPIDCATLDRGSGEPCGCYPGDLNRPLCEQMPGQTAPGNIQYWAKAYPPGRHLQVLKGYGDNSVVASICARNVTDSAAADFGYRPAIAAVIERIQAVLAE